MNNLANDIDAIIKIMQEVDLEEANQITEGDNDGKTPPYIVESEKYGYVITLDRWCWTTHIIINDLHYFNGSIIESLNDELGIKWINSIEKSLMKLGAKDEAEARAIEGFAKTSIITGSEEKKDFANNIIEKFKETYGVDLKTAVDDKYEIIYTSKGALVDIYHNKKSKWVEGLRK